MAKKQTVPLDSNAEIVEELHPTVEVENVEYEDVTGKDDLPPGVTDVKNDEEDEPPQRDTKPAAKAKPAAEDDIPEDLKGKTPAQLAKMYREAQQVIGRQGTELGDLRRTADQYIKAHLQASAPKVAPKPEEKQPDDVDFFTNPRASIERAVANHPAIKALEGQTRDVAQREMVRARTEAAREFSTRHPDAADIVQDENFRAWVVKSPMRQAMLLRAHRNYDLAAGDEIFSTWKELKAAKDAAAPAEGKKTGLKANQTLRTPASKDAARVPTGGNAAPRTAESKEGKIYRRADVIKLMETDPDRYALMADELTKAYAEGRVR